MEATNTVEMSRVNRDDHHDEHAKLIDGDRERSSPKKNFDYKSILRCRSPSVPIRYEIAFLASLGLLLSFGLRCNMGASVVAMTHNQTETLPNGTIRLIKPAQFDWSPALIGVVDSSFFWGYVILQVPGGYLATIYPSNYVFGFALGISAFLNLFIPVAAAYHFVLVIIIRATQGLVEGVTYPAAHGIWRWWAPPLERSTLATITFAGSYFGVAIGIPLSGVIIQYTTWETSFYTFGVLGLIWFACWWYVSYERPATHPRISQSERMYIEESMGEGNSIASKSWVNPPWLSVLTSMPVWAIIVANFCRSWSFYLFIDTQAKYFIDVLNFNIGKNWFLASLPHLTMGCVVPLGGKLADYLRVNYLSTTIVRKLMNCGGFGLEAIFLVVVAFARTPLIAIGALTLAIGFSGFAISGFNVNHLDLAPRYASILMGISNGLGAFAGILCPIVVELIAKNGTGDEWRNVYLLTAFIHFFGVVFYGLFASGEKQSWADPPQMVLPTSNKRGEDRDDQQSVPTYGSTSDNN